MNQSCQPSYYNHVFDFADKKILFNSRTLACAAISKENFEKIEPYLKMRSFIETNDEIVAELLKGSFLIDSNVDEKQLLKQKFLNASSDTMLCSLTIAPTMGCNFNCGYCFESELIRSQYGMMSENVQDHICEFLKNHFVRYKTKKCELTWFGGEPLLAKSALLRFGKKWQSLCEEYQIEATAGIITNGYRLDAKTAKNLSTIGVHYAQVSLDGMPNVHNARRPLKGGRGSFDTILSKIKEAADFLHIQLRINIDKTNLQSSIQLIDYLIDNVFHENISVYPAYVTSEIDVDDMNTLSLKRDKFADINHAISQQLKDTSFYQHPSINTVGNACAADHRFSYMIGPKGELYQCWDDFGRKDKVIGSIYSNGRLNQKYIDSYLNFDVTEHPKCSSCTVMPLCMGGCPKQRLIHNEPQCGIYKFKLKEKVIDWLRHSGKLNG